MPECPEWLDLRRRLALLPVCLLCCAPAWAHGGLKGSSAIWDGALHVMASPLSIAALLGTATVLGGLHVRLVYAIALVATLFAGVALLSSGYLPPYTAPVLIAVLGLIGVSGWHPPAIVAMMIAAIAGFAGGLAAELDRPSIFTIMGVLMTEAIVTVGLLTAYQDIADLKRVAPILPIAKRVLGSWIAAIGLLMTTLAFHVQKL